MKIDENMRNNIETIKSEEKKAAIDTIFKINKETETSIIDDESEEAFTSAKATKKVNEIWGDDDDSSINPAKK